MTKKEVATILSRGSSHVYPIQGIPIGVSKFQAFLAMAPILHGRLYWYALSKAYTGSDDLFSYRHDVRLAFESSEPEREYLMIKSERTRLENLPNKLKIFRGMTERERDSKEFGLSWTLDREVAEFLATKYPRNISTQGEKKLVHEIEINKSDVIALFASRRESEIIYLSK